VINVFAIIVVPSQPEKAENCFGDETTTTNVHEKNAEGKIKNENPFIFLSQIMFHD
jgi:hypothetical protein